MGLINDYELPTTKSAYADDVAELVAAHEAALKDNRKIPAWTLEDKGTADSDGVYAYPTTELVKFQAAARDAGYTAKQVEVKVDKAKHVATRFIILTPKRERKVSDKADTPAEVTEESTADA